MKVVLELQDQPSNVRRVTVRHDIVIGRGSDCNLRLSAPQVSRRHCFLRVGREGVSVTDLESSNGTYVDGKRIKPGKRFDLTGGTALAVGPIKFIVHIREEVVTADVLKTDPLNESVPIDADRRSSERATVEETLEVSGSGGSGRPLDFAVEQAGTFSDSHEPTEELKDNSDRQPESFIRRNRQSPALMDSRAEVIDLGRRIAELDAQDAARNASADTLRTTAADDRPEPAAAAARDLHSGDVDLPHVVVDAVEIVKQVESVDEVFELIDSDVEYSDEIIEVVDELEVTAEADFDVISDVEVVSDDDSGSSWFEGPAQNPQDKDDIDPDFQKFLKGL